MTLALKNLRRRSWRTIQQRQERLVARGKVHGICCGVATPYATLPVRHFLSSPVEKSGYINVDELQAQTTLDEAAALCRIALDVKGQRPRGADRLPVWLQRRSRRPQGSGDQHRQSAEGVSLPFVRLQVSGEPADAHAWLADEHTPDRWSAQGRRVPRGAQSARRTRFAVRNTGAFPETRRGSSTPLPRNRSATFPWHARRKRKSASWTTIDEKFVTDVATMNPAAAAYVRRHPCLSSESMKKWRCGYLPNDGGGDKRGWSLRGSFIYPVVAEDGQVLAWVGRDVNYEEKEREFSRLKPEERTKEDAPAKHRFPKGFHRGLELFGQQASRLQEPGYREFIARHGIIVVEGFNDVIGLDAIGVPAVGLCSNHMTEEQAKKISLWARQLSTGKVLLLLDCDDPGDDGAKEALWILAQQQLNVRAGVDEDDARWTLCRTATGVADTCGMGCRILRAGMIVP